MYSSYYNFVLQERKSGIVFLLDNQAGAEEEFFGEEATAKPTTQPKGEGKLI